MDYIILIEVRIKIVFFTDFQSRKTSVWNPLPYCNMLQAYLPYRICQRCLIVLLCTWSPWQELLFLMSPIVPDLRSFCHLAAIFPSSLWRWITIQNTWDISHNSRYFVLLSTNPAHIFSEKSYSLIFEYLMLWINAVKRSKRFFSGKTLENFFSIMHKYYINLLGLSVGRIGCFGMISSPCINIAYCSDDISRASSAERGQLNAPLSNLL